MDAAQVFLNEVKSSDRVRANFLGLLHILIGRRVDRDDGTVVCKGLTWRSLAALLRKVRWEKTAVQQLGLNPKVLPPRDREKMWYAAIAMAGVDGERAREAGDDLARYLETQGYKITPPASNGAGFGLQNLKSNV